MLCFHNPLNSDVRYRIFCVHIFLFSACVCTMGTLVYSLIQRAFVESAHNWTGEKSCGRLKDKDVTVTHPLD